LLSYVQNSTIRWKLVRLGSIGTTVSMFNTQKLILRNVIQIDQKARFFHRFGTRSGYGWPKKSDPDPKKFVSDPTHW